MIGTILGNRYELLEKIGQGGMAVVYKARCTILNRFVAVKILKPEYSNNKDFMDKFKREALATATFSHNNIVGIYDVGCDNNINYIVMEYVKGKTLKEYITENAPLDVPTTLKISIQIAKALECAHKNKIIHRDIKPHNILITEDEVVKVTDFGIAKATSSETITHTNKVVGSAHYFSPEQAKGKIVDNRTDIYSFGIVIYEMVTGKVPFDGESAVAVALKHIQEPLVPPKELVPSLPDSLNNLILKATQKEAIKRYNNVTAMLIDLLRIEKDPLYSIPATNAENELTTVMDLTDIQNTIYSTKVVNTDTDNDEDEEDDDDDDDYYDEDHKKKRKPNKWKKALIIGGATVLLIILGTLTGMYAFNSKDKKQEAESIKVPEIMGLQEAEAKAKVEEKELVFTVLGKEASDKPEGSVTAVFPNEGTEVKKNSEVRVRISSGQKEIKVPDVSNLGKSVAQNMLVDQGLKVGQISEEYSETIAEGAVIKTDPAANSSVKKGDTVNIVISKGTEVKYSKVPKLIGVNISEVDGLLASSNLKLGSSTVVVTGDKSLEGQVFAQNIDAGTKVQPNSEVSVSYYKYKDPDEGKVTVPDFIGKTRAEAEALAKEHGLQVSINGDKEGKIISQDTPKGSKVEKGSTVILSAQVEPPKDTEKEDPKQP